MRFSGMGAPFLSSVFEWMVDSPNSEDNAGLIAIAKDRGWLQTRDHYYRDGTCHKAWCLTVEGWNELRRLSVDEYSLFWSRAYADWIKIGQLQLECARTRRAFELSKADPKFATW